MTQQQIRPLATSADATSADAVLSLRREIDALRAEVTHLRGSEASLREAEDRYREIAEQSSDLISRHHADGTFLYASPAVAAILGYEPHEIIGSRVLDFIHPDDRDHALAGFEDARAAGLDHATVACRLRRKDGEYIWVESTDRFMRDDTGAVTMFHAVTRDISARKAAEDALRTSEERYRALADQSQDLISWHGPDSAFLYASPASTSLLGYEPEELLGHRPREFVHPDDVDMVLANLAAAIKGEPAVAIVCRLVHKDGRYSWFEAITRVMYDEHGDVSGFQSVTRDISARKEVEDALRSSEERYRAIAEQSHDLISRHAADGTFTYASSAARTLLGYEPSEMVGHRYDEFAHPDDLTTIRAAVRDAIAGGQPSMIACRLRHKHGHYIWFESIDRVMYDDDGKLTGFHSVTRDITARRETEDALRRSEERFRQVFELSRVGIAFVSEERRFLRVNKALCDMLEYSEDELLERTFIDITHPDDLHESNQLMDRVYSDVPDVGLEKRYVTKSGRMIWVSVNATIMPDGPYRPNESHRYNLAIIDDITHQKNAEGELRRLATLKSEFLALASHELRAPLTNINGGLEVIGPDTSLLPPASRRAIEIVSSETLRLNRLIESILDISRLDAGQLPLVVGPVALEPLLKRAAASAEFSNRVDVWVAYGLPFAWADEVYLEHIIRNVLANAAKYSAGRITLTATGDRHRLLVSVLDSGPGIPEHEQSRIFDPFFRSARTDTGVAGYGLGLYFSRRMLEAQGGSIDVRSPALDDERTPGTAFDIVLPAAPEVD